MDSDLSYSSPGNTPAVDACSLKALFMELDGPLFSYQPLLLDNNTLSVVRGPVFCFILQLYHSVCTLCDAELHLFILYSNVVTTCISDTLKVECDSIAKVLFSSNVV